MVITAFVEWGEKTKEEQDLQAFGQTAWEPQPPSLNMATVNVGVPIQVREISLPIYELFVFS